MEKSYWYVCPKCGKNLLKYREDTKIVNFPVFCKRCKKETIITIEPQSRIVNS
ncbi:MAG: cysteine-rich KTR domain-containing protein [Lachnospiraceae bacterium]|nr:cysteine-rich KTR domain-containing protein [Lachnospiraceae bacterium]